MSTINRDSTTYRKSTKIKIAQNNKVHKITRVQNRKSAKSSWLPMFLCTFANAGGLRYCSLRTNVTFVANITWIRFESKGLLRNCTKNTILDQGVSPIILVLIYLFAIP